MRSTAFAITVLLLTQSSGVAQEAKLNASYKPPILPIKVKIDTDGGVSLEADGTFVTPIGSFGVGAEIAVPPVGVTYVTIRDGRTGKGNKEYNYKIDSKGKEASFDLPDGRARMSIRDGRVVVDVGDQTDHDKVIKGLLDGLGYNHTITAQGEFRLLFKRAGTNPRTQLVYVNSTTQKFRNVSFREVWSLAAIDVQLSEETKLELLSADFKNSRWKVVKQNNGKGYTVVLSMLLPADIDSATLRDAMLSVSVIADEMERKLTGKDER